MKSRRRYGISLVAIVVSAVGARYISRWMSYMSRFSTAGRTRTSGLCWRDLLQNVGSDQSQNTKTQPIRAYVAHRCMNRAEPIRMTVADRLAHRLLRYFSRYFSRLSTSHQRYACGVHDGRPPFIPISVPFSAWVTSAEQLPWHSCQAPKP